MKSSFKAVLGILLVVLLLDYEKAFSQKAKGNGNVIKKEFSTGSFTGIDIGDAFDIKLQQTGSCSVIVETDENLMEKIKVNVANNVLRVSIKGIKNPTELNVFITVADLEKIELHGAAELDSPVMLNVNDLEVQASGASEINIKLNANEVRTEISGASDVRFEGTANYLEADVSGAANLKATSFESKKVDLEVSGAGDGDVFATEELYVSTSGAGSFSYKGNPSKKVIEGDGSAGAFDAYYQPYSDSTNMKVGGVEIGVYEDDDSTHIQIGNNMLTIDDDGKVRFTRKRNEIFKGHWAGLDLGFNGYVTSDFDMNFPREYEYLDLLTHKSLAVNINFVEQNFNLIRNKFGLLTGLGLEVHNYTFDRSIMLIPDSSELVGVVTRGVDIEKNKLVVTYMNLPLLFEYQTNRFSRSNSFHISAGAVAGVRISSHTKHVFEEHNKEYEWHKYDPEQEDYTFFAEAKSPNDSKAKNHDDFHLNPFKVDLTVRIGWNFINLWGTYSITTMFKKDKGPELYPYAIGLTLVQW